MPVTSIEEVFAVLGPDSTNWNSIIGTVESGWIEFKRAPYRLDEHRQKLELAKDVSAIANYGSGVLILGVDTERDANTASDVASEVRPIRVNMVECDQIRKIIQQYVYPHLDVSCRVWPSDDEDKALISIFVERQDDGEKFFIVTEGVSPDDEPLGSYVGVFVRQTDGDVISLKPSYLHDLIREGRRSRRGAETATTGASPEQLRALAAALGLGGAATAGKAVSADSADDQRTDDIDAIALEGESHFFLQAWPESPIELADLLDQGEQGFRTVFTSPPSLRPRGFNLAFQTTVEVLPGGALRKIRPQGLSLSVRSDGLATMVVGPYFLGWAMEKTSNPRRINPLTFVELVSEFCRFYHSHVLTQDPAGRQIRGHYRAGFRGLSVGGVTELPSGALPAGRRGLMWLESQPVVGDRDNFEVESEHQADAGEAAFDILRRVYQEFGYGPSDVPYSSRSERRVLFDELASS